MRIIAGEAKGRKLKSIKGTTTRPTSDRVKEALFNIISPYLLSKKGLDLYAGFGGLGLEALSRGVESFFFVERDKRNCQVIKENINLSGFDNRATLKKMDVFDFISRTNDKYDIIFMDPPYKQGLVKKTIKAIIGNGILDNVAILVTEHEADLNLEDIDVLKVIKSKSYGDTAITVFYKEEDR
ncbi:16S rRNA (guanine(966)-N(2))-methyltransferase RsmD [Natronospora cellulosivora (SeqCode)]